jgi:hypothetical protein
MPAGTSRTFEDLVEAKPRRLLRSSLLSLEASSLLRSLIFTFFLRLLLTSEPAVERALKAINALYELRTSCTELVKASPLSPSEGPLAPSTSLTTAQALADSTSPSLTVSIQFWLPLLRALASHTASPCWEIRVDSLQHLQRILPTSTTISHDLAITAVLFPMLDELLKPEIISLDPRGMEETRLRASALLCRVFLVYLSEKKEGAEDVLELWLGVVDALDRLMSSGRPDQLVSLTHRVDSSSVLKLMSPPGLISTKPFPSRLRTSCSSSIPRTSLSRRRLRTRGRISRESFGTRRRRGSSAFCRRSWRACCRHQSRAACQHKAREWRLPSRFHNCRVH